jgi:DNA repair photolyase
VIQELKSIPAKRIIQPNHNFNLYKGCTHGCIYCDSRSECYQIKDFTDIKYKENALQIMENELIRKRHKTILTTGSMSDPYLPIESKLQLTRGALKLILKYNFGVAVLTKSSAIERDIDLYQAINQNQKAIVCMTLTTVDDALAKKIEPDVSLPSRRLETLKKMNESGIITGVWMTPLLPFICDTEENIKSIISACHEVGVQFIIEFGIGTTMRKGSREYFYQKLDEQFPGLKQKYIKTYQDQYICNAPQHEYLRKKLIENCELYGILYKKEDIDLLMKLKSYQQLSMFE